MYNTTWSLYVVTYKQTSNTQIHSLVKGVNAYLPYIRVPLVWHYQDDQIKDDELGGASGRLGTIEMLTQFWWKNPKQRDHVQDPDIAVA